LSRKAARSISAETAPLKFSLSHRGWVALNDVRVASQPAKDSFNYFSTDDKELEKVVDNMGSYIFTQKQKLLGIANQQL
jgi:hypothetical protein